MDKPIIGITSLHRNDEDRFLLPAAYVEAVVRAGGVPMVIPPCNADPEYLLGVVDGYVFSGGGDMDPAIYGGVKHDQVASVDRERDTYELALARCVINSKQPLLAICRGMQVVNVALGGSLHEHLPDHYGNSVVHRGDDGQKVAHSVKVKPDSTLASLLKETEFTCPSYHHQCINEIAPGFEVVASATDGVVEAIESDQHPQIIAMQWHPEFTAKTAPVHQRPFDALVDMASNSSVRLNHVESQLAIAS